MKSSRKPGVRDVSNDTIEESCRPAAQTAQDRIAVIDGAQVAFVAMALWPLFAWTI
jgi:hypothetical protein